MKYVIERMHEERREWWTGDEWSEVDTDAQWYDTDAEAEAEVARIGEGGSVGYQAEEEV